jgi:hypothetical protein
MVTNLISGSLDQEAVTPDEEKPSLSWQDWKLEAVGKLCQFVGKGWEWDRYIQVCREDGRKEGRVGRGRGRGERRREEGREGKRRKEWNKGRRGTRAGYLYHPRRKSKRRKKRGDFRTQPTS